MSGQWDSLPLLPLRCILEHLNMESVLAATSTCRHWRQAMLLYEGRRNTLKLMAQNIERNIFLARLFRKHTRRLHIYMTGTEEYLNTFMTVVLPQFFEAIALQEVVFIGPLYMQEGSLPVTKLNRMITESFVFKHSKFMTKFAILGCELDIANNNKDVVQHKQLECYSKSLSFPSVKSPEDTVLSRCNVDLMTLSTLRHVIFEYEQVSTETIATLSKLGNLKQISLNLRYRRGVELPSVDWRRAMADYNGRSLHVTLNIIAVPHKRFRSMMDTVFVRGMPLTALKIMYCQTIYIPLINHVSYMYNSTLREMVWVDIPYEGEESMRTIRCRLEESFVMEVYNHVNPFIVLCWQCVNLRRLVIHGYWIWQYDMLGFARLRKSLKLEVSSLYPNQGRFGGRAVDGSCVLRVMQYDTPPALEDRFIEEMNRYCERDWQPFPWRRLPSGLRTQSTPEMRASYTRKEVLKYSGNM